MDYAMTQSSLGVAYHNIKAYIINPKQSYNFAKSLGKRSKTDKIDARTIYQYHKLIDKEKVGVGLPPIKWTLS